ncbi:MAG: thioredoxin family protein [Candidatus Saganbacteria bacterium]|nr:thioredoxin family protein [Candidatus Saganbacteria bacterium]
MIIKVLGPGCPNCQDLVRRVNRALAELKLDATVTKVTDYAEIAEYIMMTPGVVIDGKVYHEGKPLPTVEQIKGWLRAIGK